jgi:hypothetical protein
MIPVGGATRLGIFCVDREGLIRGFYSYVLLTASLSLGVLARGQGSIVNLCAGTIVSQNGANGVGCDEGAEVIILNCEVADPFLLGTIRSDHALAVPPHFTEVYRHGKPTRLNGSRCLTTRVWESTLCSLVMLM